MNRVEAYEKYVWPTLQQLSPNLSHDLAIGLLDGLSRFPGGRRAVERLTEVEGDEVLKCEAGGVDLVNPLLLAAGFDKDGRVFDVVEALGFAGMEVGSVLCLPQKGNEKPNIFRVGEKSLINRMGFPSEGVREVAKRLQHRKESPFKLGVNIGVNRDRVKQMGADVVTVIDWLYGKGDFFVLNVSSPNTKGLLDIQKDELRLREIIGEAKSILRSKGDKPLWLKVSVDQSIKEVSRLIKVAVDLEVNGIVVGNTSSDGEIKKSLGQRWEKEEGGVSGKAIEKKSNAMLEMFLKESGGVIDLIGSGGVMDFEGLLNKFRSGAKAVEMYTGFIYGGPGIVKLLKQQLLSFMEAEGIINLEELR